MNKAVQNTVEWPWKYNFEPAVKIFVDTGWHLAARLLSTADYSYYIVLIPLKRIVLVGPVEMLISF